MKYIVMSSPSALVSSSFSFSTVHSVGLVLAAKKMLPLQLASPLGFFRPISYLTALKQKLGYGSRPSTAEKLCQEHGMFSEADAGECLEPSLQHQLGRKASVRTHTNDLTA